MELLGPPFPPAAPAGDPAVSPPDSYQLLPGTGDGVVPGMATASGTFSPQGSGWQPRLLGLDKKEDLLLGEVLPVVGRSRAAGALAQEMRDMLTDLQHMQE